VDNKLSLLNLQNTQYITNDTWLNNNS